MRITVVFKIFVDLEKKKKKLQKKKSLPSLGNRNSHQNHLIDNGNENKMSRHTYDVKTEQWEDNENNSKAKH